MNKKISKSRLLELLHYDAATGLFFWKKNNKRIGTKNAAGYLAVWVDGKCYYLHRLAWAYIHDDWPECVDHINRDKSDNRLVNLRAANKGQNGINSKKVRAFSGLRGVYYQDNTKKWRVKIGRGNFGYYPTKEEAHTAYLAKARELYGDFVPEA